MRTIAPLPPIGSKFHSGRGLVVSLDREQEVSLQLVSFVVLCVQVKCVAVLLLVSSWFELVTSRGLYKSTLNFLCNFTLVTALRCFLNLT